MTGIPRGLPRGLIEADDINLEHSVHLHGFRGDFPAASLKLYPSSREALRSPGFRGDFPAASLKHPVPQLDVPQPGPIPRGLPRGLIEASSMRSRRWLTGGIPRGLPRGLIEASTSRSDGGGTKTIPRGLPRGLIEASSMPLARLLILGRFRGDFPAASLKHYGVICEMSVFRYDSAGTSPRPH